MKARHCLQVGNNQEKKTPSKEVNSRSLEEYELCCISASKNKNQTKTKTKTNHQNDSQELDLHLNVQN